MGIKKVEVYSVTLGYVQPFRISSGTSTESHNVLVKIITDYGVIGWGEASPSRRMTGENKETIIGCLYRIAPTLIGMCPLRIEHIIEAMDKLVEGNPAAKASIDMALYDILGKTVDKPLFMILGGYRTEILTDLTLSVRPPEEMAEDALKAVRAGFKALKLKVGVDPIEDVERVRYVREVVGEKIQLRVDANQGWNVEQAIDVISKISEFNIQFVEEPVKGGSVEDLKIVKETSSIPIMADESVRSPEEALKMVKQEAVDLINIKLMKSGGILKARKIAAVAESAGIPCMVGCMGESEVGISAAAHLAAAIKNIQYADLDSDILIRDKIVKVGGVGIEDSNRIFPRYSGLGVVELNEGLLGKPLKVFE